MLAAGKTKQKGNGPPITAAGCLALYGSLSPRAAISSGTLGTRTKEILNAAIRRLGTLLNCTGVEGGHTALLTLP